MAENKEETAQERAERVAKENEERRQEAAEVSPHVRTSGVAPTYGEADENGFVGVAPEYANYANETEKPLEGDGSEPEQQVVDPEDEKARQEELDQKAQAATPAQPARPAQPAQQNNNDEL